jgi:antitoxin (DNA-binding transcriptional repressor) of toxin-antitoxin stability system
MTILQEPRTVSVTEATQRGVAGLVADAERGVDVIVARRGQPIVVVLSMHRIGVIEEAVDDLRDLALVLARATADTGERTSLDDVIHAFGHSRESLEALPDNDWRWPISAW